MKHGGKKGKLGMLGLVAVLLLNGCMGIGEEMGVSVEKGDPVSQQASEFRFLEEEEITWEDNRVDDLHAVFNLPLKWVKTEGQLKDSSEFIVGEGGGVRVCGYLCEESNVWQTDIVGVTSGGEEYSMRFSVGSERADNFIHYIGPISGEKGYVACYCMANKEGKAEEYWFTKLDESFQKVSRIQARMEMDNPLRSIMGDINGNYHVIYDIPNDLYGEWYYVIVSPSGDKIYETKLENMGKLCTYLDGSVVVCDEQIYDLANKPKEHRFYRYEADRGMLVELAVSKDEAVQKKMSSFLFAVAPIDEDKIAWCTPAGINVYDRKSKKTTDVYRWSKHGIALRDVWSFMASEDGSLGIIYEDSSGINYLLLEPSGDKEEQETIAFAVSSDNKQYYEKIATLFKKHYPSYIIDLRDDYDQTSLLTWLGAGEGPVLIDTELTGFETLEKLWQPMDGFLEQTGLAGQIYPEALDLGKIGDVTYGIVRNFRIETLLVSNKGPSDWDYNGFLNALEKSGGAAFTYRDMEFDWDWRKKYFDILKNGYDDTYFLNRNNGSVGMVFGTEEFERVLRLSDKAANCLPPEEGKTLKSGKALCEPYEMVGLWDVLRLHRKMEANGEKAIGYPTRDGARHLLIAQSQVTMRSTATEEEKKIAYTFLKFMLSEEAYQASPGVGFPVRSDAIEGLLDDFEETVEAMKKGESYDPVRTPELHREEDKKFYEGLIQNSKVKKPFPAELTKVFDEEFGEYLAGRIDGRMLDDHLKSRVWLYLEESK